MREEKVIFSELAKLCTSAGYPHVIAYFCYRDYIIEYSGKLTAQAILTQYSGNRLLKTEILILIGLMIKSEINSLLPDANKMELMINRTEILLNELHQCLVSPMKDWHHSLALKQNEVNPFTQGTLLREAIFYGGESAYDFQYRDLAVKKYNKDNDWLKVHKGFTIEDSIKVIFAIKSIQNRNLNKNSQSSILSIFTFSTEEIEIETDIKKSVVSSVLQSFTVPKERYNEDFNELDDFNIISKYPLIKIDNNKYLLFLDYILTEAIYQTPFYWMREDKHYYPAASKNRGTFVELFSEERLKFVFGNKNIFSNVRLIQSKNVLTEIDVLAIFAGRAIIIQAKAKGLTLIARKGNDEALKNDFKKSIQDAYDQALLCGKLLIDNKYRLVNSDSQEITISRDFKEVYLFCIVGDHYPALSFQARQFLQIQETPIIKPPYIMDVFTLDTMTEMLQKPLYFLSYISRRAQYYHSIFSVHELSILGYHLKKNLHRPEKCDFMYIDGSMNVDLDLAMKVRRIELPGEPTPDGILTRFKHTPIGNLISKIETIDNIVLADLGELLLTLSEETMLKINKGLEQIIILTKYHKIHHDFSVAIGVANTGITVHVNDYVHDAAKATLNKHCDKRKYIERANSWFGICINSDDNSICASLKLEYPWKNSKKMNKLIEKWQNPKRKKKPERNEKCFCGSGLKFKKCCLFRT